MAWWHSSEKLAALEDDWNDLPPMLLWKVPSGALRLHYRGADG